MVAIKEVPIPFEGSQDKDNYEKTVEKILKEVKLQKDLQDHKNVARLYGYNINTKDCILLLCIELMDISLKKFYGKVHQHIGTFPEYLG